MPPLPKMEKPGFSLSSTTSFAQDPLPSWKDRPAKQAIVGFVTKVTKEGSPDFVPPAERIATFDNDGTLWVEQPMYFQFLFALDRVKTLAPQHPEWKEKEPFASLLKGDLKTALAAGERAMLEIVMATHAGMTTKNVPTMRNASRVHSRSGNGSTQSASVPAINKISKLYIRQNVPLSNLGFFGRGELAMGHRWFGLSANVQRHRPPRAEGPREPHVAAVWRMRWLGIGYFATLARTAQARAVNKIEPFTSVGRRSRMRSRKRTLAVSPSDIA
jgi:hypothetical protein